VLLTSLERTPGRDGVPSHAARGSLTWTPKLCPRAFLVWSWRRNSRTTVPP